MAHIRKITNLLPQPVRFGLRKLMFSGKGQFCELCETEVRGYKPHGGGAEVLDRRQVVGGMRREDDRCPVCHACDRTRMMKLYLEEETDLGSRPMKVAHVAPDFGLYLWLKRQPQTEYTGTDIDAGRYRHIDHMVDCDLTAAPFADNSFDIVICSHVLEHIPDDTKAMTEILRILKPGGHALLLTPLAIDGKGTEEDITINDPEEQDRRFGQWDHVRIYSRDDFLQRLRNAGFEVSTFAPYERDAAQAERLHLNPIEVLPIGRKPVLN